MLKLLLREAEAEAEAVSYPCLPRVCARAATRFPRGVWTFYSDHGQVFKSKSPAIGLLYS